MRVFPFLLLLAALLTGSWRRARADEAVVVLDRGTAAKATAERDQALAIRLLRAFEAAGHDVRFVVYGSREDGRMRAAELRGDPEEALARAGEREGWGFEGPTDPRLALELLVRRRPPGPAARIVLVGPFRGEAADEKEAAKGLESWNERAEPDTRVLPIGLAPDRLGVLTSARGLVEAGAIVLATGEVETVPGAFSPLAMQGVDPPRLDVLVRVPVDAVPVGRGPGEVLLAASTDGPRDQIESAAPPTLEAALFRVQRPGDGARVGTIRFETRGGDAVLWLTDAPPPRTWQWRRLLEDHALRDAGGGPPRPFHALGVQADRPVVAGYRLVRSRVGEAPVVAVEGTSLPEGLEVEIAEEIAQDEEIASRDVTVRFHARAGRPEAAEGRIVLASADDPDVRFEIPYRVQVPPGRVRVRLEAGDDPTPLPMDDERPWILAVEALDANVPRVVRLRWQVEPSTADVAMLEVNQQDDVTWTWRPEAPVELRPGVRYEVRPRSSDTAPAGDAEITIAVAEGAGVVGETVGVGRTRARRPRLVLARGDFLYRVDRDEVVGAPPLTLDLDPDGGGAAWRSWLNAGHPVQVETDPKAPLVFEVVSVDAEGTRLLQAAGPWRGERADLFTDRRETVRVGFSWAPGQAPPAVDVPVLVPARWGAAGWILLVLAGLALALGAWGLLQLRAAPVEGTLLWAADDRPGAVGRLDLQAVGRRAATLRVDRSGRVALGGGGDAIGALRPTRVGGLLVVGTPSGPEEHLLVDGLTVRAGAYRLRYVSGRPDDSILPPVESGTEDLLGPEYDLSSGRIAALESEPEDEDADGAAGRS